MQEIKTDHTRDIKAYRTNEMCPKIDNLEYLPTEVLLTIFAFVKDIDLVHLAEISRRFRRIAQITIENKIFVMSRHDEVVKQSQVLGCFGDHIKAVEFNGYFDADNESKSLDLLKQHVKHIECLKFNRYTFRGASYNI